MKQILVVFEIVIAVALIGVILIQAKGTGLGSSFGGSGELYRSKMGVEKVVTLATVALIAAFGIVSFILLILK